MLGSEGLYCYDRHGNLRWKQDLGVLDSGYYLVPAAQWGFASSPVIFQDLVIVQCDIQMNSFLAAFDLFTGVLRWRTKRDDVPSWSTPTVYTGPAGTQLIVNGYRHAGGYDPYTGSELWKLTGGGDIPVPTPIVAQDLVILASAHGPLAPLTALRPGARGDITLQGDASSNDHILWQNKRDGTYMQTPIVWDDYVYACKDNGILSCYELGTGKLQYRERLGTGSAGFTASPVAADGRLYFTNELGETFVISAGPTFQLLATNPLSEFCLATPAVTNGMLVIRTTNRVWGIGQPVVGPDEVAQLRTPFRRTAFRDHRVQRSAHFVAARPGDNTAITAGSLLVKPPQIKQL
jgi:outer membrane protein assembly factor BamB